MMIVIGVLMVKEKVEEIGLNEVPNAKSFRNMTLVKINLEDAYSKKPYFDVLIHNMTDFLNQNALSLHLEAEEFYKSLIRNPKIICIDPVDSIKTIVNRYDQLRLARDSLKSFRFADKVHVPPFCLLENGNTAQYLEKINSTGLAFPIICKPVRAQGEGAHDMVVVFNESGMEEVKYPVVAQQFVNHNAMLFKISVVGEHVFVTTRPSIKNMQVSDQRPIFFHSFSVSKTGCDSLLTRLDPDDQLSRIVPENDEKLFYKIASKIRQDFNLDLFSIDVIECVEAYSEACQYANPSTICAPRFAVIDVNPLPSYTNVPTFHHHLGNLIRKKLKLPIVPLTDAK